MCEICRSFPCVSRCPNAKEPQPVLECDECKEDIYEGEEYYTDNGWNVCVKCQRKKLRIAGE